MSYITPHGFLYTCLITVSLRYSHVTLQQVSLFISLFKIAQMVPLSVVSKGMFMKDS